MPLGGSERKLGKSLKPNKKGTRKNQGKRAKALSHKSIPVSNK
jgi:hypothetical protein